jgi:hypothetical protein
METGEDGYYPRLRSTIGKWEHSMKKLIGTK